MPSRLLLLAALVLAAAPARAVVSAPDAPADPEVVALVFAADWCGACKILDPKLTPVMQAAGADGPVRFVRLDHTDADARAAAAATAAELGLASLYADYAGQTGFVLLVDAASGALLDRIEARDSPADIDGKLRRAVARAS